MTAPHTMLICTVGGSPEPIVASIKQWQPARIWFLVTPETRAQVVEKIIPLAKSQSATVDPGYHVVELVDSQDFTSCIDRMRTLHSAVQEWLAREETQVVVDITGGTKCMSAALALHARRWPCIVSYIGGSGRTKEGIGVVESGKEQIVYRHNPWEELGYQLAEEGRLLFNRRLYAAARVHFQEARQRVSDPTGRREYQALLFLADTFVAWDRFDHKAARASLQQLETFRNDLPAVLGVRDAAELLKELKPLGDFLGQLLKDPPLSRGKLVDLLANARRRKEEGRLDDAVARLYRVIEAAAQLQLRERHGIGDTGNIAFESLPTEMQQQWQSRRKENGTVSLGLKDDYKLLMALGDELGNLFETYGLHKDESALSARNQSILAHGFDPAGPGVFDTLWVPAMRLVGATENELPVFPRLGSSRYAS